MFPDFLGYVGPTSFSLFFLGGGTQFVLFCSIDSCTREKRNIRLFLFFCLILISISCLLSSWPVCAASCVLLWFVCSRPRGVGFYGSSGVIVFGVCLTGPFSCRLLRTVHLILWEEQQQVFASFPRVRSAAHRAAGSSCPQGSRFSAVIGLCRSLWRPLAAAAEVASDSSAS